MTFTGMGRHKPHRRRLSPVQLLILAILKKGPAHGYIIIQKLGQRLGPRRVKSGTIYPALHRLVEKELIHGTHILQEDGPVRSGVSWLVKLVRGWLRLYWSEPFVNVAQLDLQP
ncbi:MAG: PadR family transcriptional regulator [Candidatus Thorarchaeota archaeon]|jgi:hypothetical protein